MTIPATIDNTGVGEGGGFSAALLILNWEKSAEQPHFILLIIERDSDLFSGRIRPSGRKQLNHAFSRRSKNKSRDSVTATLWLKWPQTNNSNSRATASSFLLN
jgi:hypothetical protein